MLEDPSTGFLGRVRWLQVVQAGSPWLVWSLHDLPVDQQVGDGLLGAMIHCHIYVREGVAFAVGRMIYARVLGPKTTMV